MSAKKKKEPVQKTVLPVESPLYLRGYFPGLIIALLAFLVYAPTLWYDFSPMDERWLIISQKELMSHVSNLPVLFRSSMMGMYYRPVCSSSFMFDLILGNGSPFIFHFTNILLHVLCSLLLFRFFLQLNISRPIAFISALLFAVHPISVHAVAWIPGRNDSLLCVFTILSCSQLVLYFNTRKIIYLFIHLLAFGLALFSKENAILLPVLYFLLWFLFQKEREFRKLAVPVFTWLIIGISWFFIRKHVIDYFPPLTTATTGKSLLNFLKALTAYTGKFILPVDQSVMPVLRDMSLTPYLVATILLILATLKFGLRDRKIALLGFIWFYIFLFLPAWVGATDSNGDQYEHRIYTSLVGAFLFLSQLKISIDPALARKLSIVILIIFSVKTIMRCNVYTDEFSFLQAATAESPSVSLFHDMLGYKYVEQKDYKNAIESFSEAIRLDPNRYEYYNHRGSAYFDTKNYKLAMDDFNKTISGKNDEPVSLINRSMTNFYLGNHTEALRDLEHAKRAGATTISPDYVRDLFTAFQRDTISIYTRKIAEDSLDENAYNMRGIARLRINQFKESIADFEHALRLDPTSKAFQYNRNLAIQKMNENQHPGNK